MLFRPRSPSFRRVAAPLLSLLLLALTPAPGRAGPPATPAPAPAPPGGGSRWSLGLETSYQFQPVPNPFFKVAGYSGKNPLNYHLVTQIVSVRYRVTDTAGPGPLRGNLEVSGGPIYSAILHGPESFFAGLAFNVRYTFVPRGWPVQPFLEVGGGPGWTDSRGFRYAQQQDFTFTYLLGAGLRYEVTPRWNVTLGALDQHISNAYLTNPNYGFDTVGVRLGAARRF